MKSTITTFLLCLTSLIVIAQDGETFAKGAKSLSMAGADVLFTGVESIHTNQAGIAYADGLGIMVAANQPYSLAEVSDISLGLVLPTKTLGNFGVSVSRYGFDTYNEMNIGVAYGRKLMRNLAIGAKLNMHSRQITNFDSKFTPTVKLGLQSKLLPDLSLGFHISNPINTKLTDEQSLPTKISIGTAYTPNKKLMVSLEAEKYIDSDLNIAAGIDYRLIPLLSLRVGAGTNPGLFAAGIGVHISDYLTIEGGITNHETLGITPGVSVRYAATAKSDDK